jgi:hypothetical protein
VRTLIPKMKKGNLQVAYADLPTFPPPYNVSGEEGRAFAQLKKLGYPVKLDG